MTRAHTPQTGDPIDHFSAIVGGEVHAVSRHKNTRILLEMPVGRERQPLVVHVDLKGAGCARSFLRRHVIASLQIKCQKLDKNSVTPSKSPFRQKGLVPATMSLMNHAFILTLSCPDRTGIVHAVSGFLLERGGNIEEAAQYNDHDTGLFFMRMQFACDQVSEADLRSQLASFAVPFQMTWNLHNTQQPMPAVILVSKEGHCLNDLLFRWKSGLLPIDIRAIVSNHREFYQLAASYNVPFHHIPVTAANKAEAEAKQYEIIQSEGAELVVLARYMQILSDDLCRKLSGRAINIHHSFLPSFKGAKPYYQAHDRGVKLIGATAHYVTADLDEGPIIEQDVARVDHSKTVEDLTTQGRDTESQVLARAVKWHSEHRVLLNGHKTVIFK
jgi:formyltetrahydrofolate deformylase